MTYVQSKYVNKCVAAVLLEELLVRRLLRQEIERKKNHVHRQLGMSDINDPLRQSLPLA